MTWLNKYNNIFFKKNQCPNYKTQHYKWMKNANGRSKMQSKMGAVPAQMKRCQQSWTHLPQQKSQHTNTTARHSLRLMVVNAKEPLCQPRLGKPLWRQMKNWWQRYEERSRCTPALSSSPGPAFAPASRLLCARRSRRVEILYRHPSYWLNNKALKMYFKRYLSDFATCFWILELLEHLTLLGSYSSLQLRRKKRPIAMLCDYFYVLLSRRADVLRLNYTAFFKNSRSSICHPKPT